MRTLLFRVIGALWIFGGVYWVLGVTRDEWRDVTGGHFLLDELLLRGFFLACAALAVWAGVAVCRGRRWGIWALRVLALLLLFSTLSYLMSGDATWADLGPLTFPLLTLFGLMFARPNEHVA